MMPRLFAAYFLPPPRWCHLRYRYYAAINISLKRRRCLFRQFLRVSSDAAFLRQRLMPPSFAVSC